MRPQLELVLSYLGLDPARRVPRLATSVPPFVLDSAVLRSLIDGIEQRIGRTLPEKFLANGLTEFFLYAGWIIASGGSLDDAFELPVQPRPYIWRATANREGVERAIRTATNARAELFAAHRLALPRLDVESGIQCEPPMAISVSAR